MKKLFLFLMLTTTVLFTVGCHKETISNPFKSKIVGTWYKVDYLPYTITFKDNDSMYVVLNGNTTEVDKFSVTATDLTFVHKFDSNLTVSTTSFYKIQNDTFYFPPVGIFKR